MNGLMVAGTASGVGKTTVTLALIAALRRRGRTVQPLKSGPDFLDPGHHTRLAGRTARTLDTWMLSAEANEEVLREAAAGADLLVVEGMMGLFDGEDGASERGSSAEIAKMLKLPVVLVLDAATSVRSLAAVLLGFEEFDPELTLAGVILNRVGGEGHFGMLERAIASRCRTPVLGWLPWDAGIAIAERHLGLQTAEELDDPDLLGRQTEALASLGEKHFNLDALSSLRCGLVFDDAPADRRQAARPCVRIGVARDHAFSFYYEDNLDLLRQAGAEIVSFSPLRDGVLPDGLDALYLGGGYPELYAAQLSANLSMLGSLRTFAASNRPIYAECGGMIYLSRQLTVADGSTHALAGVLPFAIAMTGTLAKFGYVTVELTRDCLLGRRGTVLRGHSFHFSQMAGTPAVPSSYAVCYSLSGMREEEGFTLGGVLASYVHLHFRAAPDVARHFVECAARARNVV